MTDRSVLRFGRECILMMALLLLIITGCVADQEPSATVSAEHESAADRVATISPYITSGERESVHRNGSEISDMESILSSLPDIAPLSSIVVQYRGEVVGEAYFGSMRANRTHNVKSVSKSILSILVGIAIDKGYIDGVDQTIGEFFPDWFETNPDPEKEAITVGDLLTMRSGLASTSGRNYGPWVVSRNWAHYALARPMTGRAGIDRTYSTGTTHLLGIILARASGMDLRQFANRYLFGPMGIRLGGWDRDPQGYYLGGNNMALQPRDMAKIGQLMMNVGEWNGEQIVSREWVIRSVQPFTGRGNEQNYGYLWFRRMSGDYDVVYAWGNGGQFIKIIPELELVIAITSREGGGATRQSRFELYQRIDEAVIPAVQQQPAALLSE